MILPPTNLQAASVRTGARSFRWEHSRRMLKRSSKSACRNNVSGLVSDYTLGSVLSNARPAHKSVAPSRHRGSTCWDGSTDHRHAALHWRLVRMGEVSSARESRYVRRTSNRALHVCMWKQRSDAKGLQNTAILSCQRSHGTGTRLRNRQGLL